MGARGAALEDGDVAVCDPRRRSLSRLAGVKCAGAWRLPEPWTHSTRPPLLGKPHRTRFPTAPTRILGFKEEKNERQPALHTKFRTLPGRIRSGAESEPSTGAENAPAAVRTMRHRESGGASTGASPRSDRTQHGKKPQHPTAIERKHRRRSHSTRQRQNESTVGAAEALYSDRTRARSAKPQHPTAIERRAPSAQPQHPTAIERQHRRRSRSTLQR